MQMNVLQKDTLIGAILWEPTMCSLSDSNFYGGTLHLKTTKKQLFERNENLKKRALAEGDKRKLNLFNEIKFNGELADNKNQLNGELSLDGKIFPVELFRSDKPIFRPQEPKKPYPYYSEDIRFRNKKDRVVIAGTLTTPKKEGKFPAVILQSGSTPSNRDAESYHHKMFLVLADYLTRNGIAVLRCDDRGVGRSTGNFEKSTPLDLAGDLLAGREFLASRKEIISNKIGIIGHSEGGMVAAMAASQSKDFNLIVMLGSVGLRMRDVFEEQIKTMLKNGEMNREQYELQQKVNQKVYKMMEQNLDTKMMKDSLKKFKVLFLKNYFDSIATNPVKQIEAEILFSDICATKISHHNLFNLNVNPSDYIEQVTCPVLSLSGSNDRLVISTVNQEAIRKALFKAGNKDFQIIEQEGLNHFFQDCKKGTITEALTLEQTFSPKALEIITEWIKAHVEK
jgi:pimeloyl-ACP methyl ester carboxylesterase